MMKRSLTGCTLTGNFNLLPDFSAFTTSLRYQAQALGFTLEQELTGFKNLSGLNSEQGLTFDLQTSRDTSVTCSVSRWQDTSVQFPVTENTLQAACGLMSVHGRATGHAQALGVNYVSALSAALALQGGMAATIGQLRGLPITQSHVAMSAAALLSVGQYLAGATAEELPEKLIPGTFDHPDCPPFVSADGVVFELETLDAKPWQAFWTDLGIDRQLAGKGWTQFLLRYAKAIAPLPEELINAIAAVPYSQISELAKRHNVSLCPVRSLAERAEDIDCRRVFQQGPWAFTSLATIDNPLKTASRNHLPLSGLTIIESCRRIQGPLAGHLLSLLGAKVIRIEPVGGDPLRGMPPMADGISARFDALNRHKTVREIDIKSSEGKAEIYELVRNADVFLHNWAPGNAEKLQLSAAELQGMNPALVYAHAAGWSTENAIQDDLLGTDFVTQAYSGVAQQIAQQSGQRGGSLFTVLDVLGGVVAAQGITAALLQRELSPQTICVTSSLASAAVLLTAESLQQIYSPEPDHIKPASLINAVYQTQQGKLVVECADDASVTRLIDAISRPDRFLKPVRSEELAEILLTKTAQEWLEILQTANIAAAVVVEDLTDLLTNPLLQPCLSAHSYTHVTSPWSFS
jgi:crotonobetainyl-CoA:carnitine CoA-transferase CaiB-like acyl-CoA transferase